MSDHPYPPTLSVEEATRVLDSLIEKVGCDKTHVVLTRNGEKVATIVPIEVLPLLERVLEVVEDYVDSREAERILTDPEAERLSWEDALKEIEDGTV